jgi:hypothetical protein
VAKPILDRGRIRRRADCWFGSPQQLVDGRGIMPPPLRIIIIITVAWASELPVGLVGRPFADGRIVKDQSQGVSDQFGIHGHIIVSMCGCGTTRFNQWSRFRQCCTFAIAGLFLGALGAGRDRSQRGDSGKRRSWGDRPAKGDIRGGIGINPCFGHLLGFRATAG